MPQFLTAGTVPAESVKGTETMQETMKFSLLFTSVLVNSILVIYIISNKTENETPAGKIPEISSWNEDDRLNSPPTLRLGLETEEVPFLSPSEKLFKLYDGVETFVLFIGYPRSSHSLVGAILDAHPEIIIPHEYDVIEKWKLGLRPKKLQKYVLFYELHQLSMKQAMFGNRANANNTRLTGQFSYTYNVPGLWQGGYQKRIKVIGDKKGGKTATRLMDQTGILEKLKEALQVQMKFIHITRNPFDNIATIMLRATNSRDAVRQKGAKVNNTMKLDKAIASYFRMAASNQRVRELYRAAVLDIPGHETVLRPRETLQRLCDHLGVTCFEEYIEKCIKILYGTPSVTRNKVVWTKEQKRRVTEMMKNYPFLQGYSFNKYPK